ncbi:acyl-CoA carboxylase subunit beta [Defluviitalea phaphyphila]|uniref:acyl-CoA carboxylase subunit beta n=1 Tax=Defluviitalea phaphyphila TaxID=1473580 RepID=UPI0038BCBCE5
MGGGEAEIKKLHSEGKLTARERIEKFLDEGSFVELGAFVKHRSTDFNMSKKNTPADGVVTGYGTVEGRLVYVYSQDATVLGGSVGEMHAKKIASLYDYAMKMGAPIISFLDSSGLRLQESIDGLNGYGTLFLKQSIASGIIPQISVIFGDCVGGAGFSAGISDFTFMVSQNGRLFMNSPNTIEGIEGKKATFESIGSADIHSEKSGMVHFQYDKEEECIEGVRNLISYLPGNNLEDAPIYEATDDLNRVDSVLDSIIPEDLNESFDVKTVIASIADDREFLEIQSKYAKNLVIGFIRLNGSTVGIIANQSQENEGLLNIAACNKGTDFVNFCDAFNIPIISLTDVGGFISSVEEEQKGILKNASKLVYAFANATVPKVNVIIRKAFGSAYIAMNSKHIGADIVFAWPTAQISVMNPEGAVNIMYAEELKNSENPNNLRAEKIEEFSSMQGSAYAAASRGYVDDIIEPSATRKRIIAALEMLYSKREQRPAKKHGTV